MNVALHHVPQHSFIELLRPVCCPHDEHPVISSRLHLKPESSPTSVSCDKTRVSSRRSTSTVETETTLTPSNSTRNSVFSLREASCSPSLLSHSKLSTSSRCNMTKDEMRELGRCQSVRWRHMQPTGQAAQTNKDDGRLQFSGHCKQRSHELLSFSHL